MRRALDALYAGSGVLAAGFLAAICLTVLVQVGFNLLDRVAEALTGRPVGLVLPSYAEFTGYFLAAATFLAGAGTLRAGVHIRVRLVLDRLGPGARRAAEVWCTGVGALFMLYFTGWSALLAHESWAFGDVSPGIVPVAIWIPQAAMTFGLAVFTVALADGFVAALRGRARDDA
jgi:TRAP-type C4-dicarboxylate transport system permease small subunit